MIVSRSQRNSAREVARAMVSTPRRKGSVPEEGEDRGEGREALEAAGVCVLTVPSAGHNIVLDNPDAFAAVVSGRW